MAALNGLGAITIILMVILAILWILLPFAVFGIKDLAKQLIKEQQRTNKLLESLLDHHKYKDNLKP